MGSTRETAEARLRNTLKEMNFTEGEIERFDTEKNIKERLLEIQDVYDKKKAKLDKAYKTYLDSRLTMSSIIESVSFSRPTMYKDDLVKNYAEALVRKSSENDIIRKMEQAVLDKQAVERYNEALVRDVLELLHNKEDYDNLVEQVDIQNEQIADLEAKLGVKSTVLPMERRAVTKPNNLEGVFPTEFHRD